MRSITLKKLSLNKNSKLSQARDHTQLEQLIEGTETFCVTVNEICLLMMRPLHPNFVISLLFKYLYSVHVTGFCAAEEFIYIHTQP